MDQNDMPVDRVSCVRENMRRLVETVVGHFGHNLEDVEIVTRSAMKGVACEATFETSRANITLAIWEPKGDDPMPWDITYRALRFNHGVQYVMSATLRGWVDMEHDVEKWTASDVTKVIISICSAMTFAMNDGYTISICKGDT